MESLQEDVTELRATLGTRMNQFMEAMQAMAKGQEELRAAIQRPPSAEATVQNLVPPPVTDQPTPAVGFVPPAGLVFTPPNGAGFVPPSGIGFIPPSGIGFVPPQGTGSIHPGVSFGPRVGPMQFPNLNNQQRQEEAQVPPVRRTIITPAPHLVDNQEDVFSMQDAMEFPVEAERKFQLFEERLKAMENSGISGIDLTDMGLVPGLRIPPKFKVPEFDKYKGTTCPKTHVRAYYRKMSAYTDDEKLLMHFFQDSLSGASLEWYMQLESSHIHTWRDLVEAFIRHYQYNTDLAPNRTQLQNLTQGSHESFKAYAQRWRELAARVQPPLLERELVDMFMGTLQGPYYAAMIGCTSTGFTDLVMAGERVEAGIKTGKIQVPVSSSASGAKKSFGSYQKKKEGETSALFSQANQFHQRAPRQRAPYQPNFYQQAPTQQPLFHPVPYRPVHHQAAAVTIPNAPRRQQVNNRQQYPVRPFQQQKPRYPERKFDPIPMSYSQLLQHLLQQGLIELRTMNPPVKLPADYDANARCEFHSGAPGHGTENCRTLKHKVQDLIDSKAIDFAPRNGPNVTKNPMPPHHNHSTNAIDSCLNLVCDVNLLKTPLSFVKKKLLECDVFPGCSEDCQLCLDQPEGCENLKLGIQCLIDQKRIQFDRPQKSCDVSDVATVTIPYDPVFVPVPEKRSPLIITVPGPLPFESTKAIPWSYGAEVFYKGEKQEIVDTGISNTTGERRFTRSGRVFSQPPVVVNDRSQGKQPVVSIPNANPGASVSREEEEVEELMKIIKRSDYKIVEQLNQTPSKISILSLLLSSESHRNALMKILGAAFVPQEISVNQLEGVAAGITAGRSLGFSDEDLPPEGRCHNKALHISIECADTTLSRVLVDTGSSLNVLPKTALMRLNYEGLVLKPSDLVVRAFDGSRRSVFGEIELPIKVGPHVFRVTFFVMDIQPAYSCLLGRPWIHDAGAVTSTLHQKLKYVVDNQVVTVGGEEDFIVSHLSSHQYVEVGGEYHETPCQVFDFVAEREVPPSEEKKSDVSMVSFKEAKAIVESGHPAGWGRVLDLPAKFDKMGLGYNPAQDQNRASSSKNFINFTRGGVINEGNVLAVGNEKEDSNMDQWIRPSASVSKINNWTVKEIVPVTRRQE